MPNLSPNLWLKVSLVIFCFITGWMVEPKIQQQLAPSQEAPPRPAVIPHPDTSDSSLTTQWENTIKPMLEHYCYDCHGDGSSKGDLCFDDFEDLSAIRSDPKTWDHILSRVDYQLMPPSDEEQPKREEAEQLIAWINDTVFPVYQNPKDPGPNTARRMNRTEYQNTIRDLLGIEIDILELLPPDDSAHGFDNVNTALTISPAHIERYLKASDAALDKAIIIGPMPSPVTRLDLNKALTGGQHRDDGIFLFTSGSAVILHDVKHEGKYTLHVTASASRSGNEFAKLEIGYPGSPVTTFSIENPMHRPKVYTTKLKLKHGTNELRLNFPNDHYDPKHPDPNMRDRNLMIHKVTLENPKDLKQEKPESHRSIFPARKLGISDSSYTHEVLKKFAKRAFRRPVNDEEIKRYVQLATSISASQGTSIEHGIRGAIQAILVSPSFLFLNLPENQSEETGEIKLVSEHSLASRLSYFLWNSMPDDTLLELANNNQLRKQLDSQIKRMLHDPRAKAFTHNFAGQWLQLRDLSAISPDKKTFPDFTSQLRDSMRTETELLVDEIILQDKNLLDLINADYSYLNNRLAQHYGIPGIEDGHFRKVDLSGTPRRGILTHASILTLTSQPTRTSPVLRGKYILENILHITPPPPPPNLPPLEDSKATGDHLSIRQQLELHREKPSCASCHNLMDPIGFAMENYNAIGAWQDTAQGKKIDTKGQLVTGEKIDGTESLLKILTTNKKDQFLHSLTTKMLTYALGRVITRSDRHHVENILRRISKEDNHAHSLIRAIVHSPPFQYRRN